MRPMVGFRIGMLLILLAVLAMPPRDSYVIVASGCVINLFLFIWDASGRRDG